MIRLDKEYAGYHISPNRILISLNNTSAAGLNSCYFFQIKYILVSRAGTRGRKVRSLSSLVSASLSKERA